MALSRAKRLVNKSVAAMISAIEIYNKPDYQYREETFSILALNAWELLLKAFILDRNNNKMSSLYVYERRYKKNGAGTRKLFIKRNRVGNPMTIGLDKAFNLIESKGLERFDYALKANIEGLAEVRDNAVHFANNHLGFSKTIQELGTATVQNYVELVKKWFNYDLSRYNFYLMPLAFFRSFQNVSPVDLTSEEKNVIQFLTGLNKKTTTVTGNKKFNVLLEMDVKLKRSRETAAARIAIGNDPSAIPVKLTEEDIRENYPWDYDQLTSKLYNRYSDFKTNNKYHDIRRSLREDPQYVMQRFLDPGNPKSPKKDFFSPNVLNIFDHYYNKV